MATNDGTVIAVSEPQNPGNVLWLKFNADGSKEWRERVGDSWNLLKTEGAPLTADGEGVVSPTNLQIHNLNITGNLFYNGDNGANNDITVGGIHMVVKEGIVTTLEEV